MPNERRGASRARAARRVPQRGAEAGERAERNRSPRRANTSRRSSHGLSQAPDSDPMAAAQETNSDGPRAGASCVLRPGLAGRSLAMSPRRGGSGGWSSAARPGPSFSVKAMGVPETLTHWGLATCAKSQICLLPSCACRFVVC